MLEKIYFERRAAIEPVDEVYMKTLYSKDMIFKIWGMSDPLITKKLSALYYPFSRCLDEEALKRSILYFDEIAFIDPLNPDDRDNALSSIPTERLGRYGKWLSNKWYSIREDYSYLAKEGIIRIIDPSPFLEEWDMLFLASLKSDLSDDMFIKLSFLAGPMVWNMLRSKMPPSIFAMLDPRGGTFVEAMGRLEELYTDHPRTVFKISKWFGEYTKYVARGLYTGEGDVYSLSYPQGASLNLTQALLVSEFENIYLWTDNNVHHSLLLRKFQRAIEHPELMTVRRIIVRETSDELMKRQLIATNIIETLIPHPSLSNLSLQDVVKYRRACEKDLVRFRTLVRKISADIEVAPWDTKFESEIRKNIDTEVLPAVRELQDELEGVYVSLFGRLAKRTLASFAAGGTALISTLFSGLPPFALLTLSCSALAAVLGYTSVELVEALIEKKRVRQNSLSYILKIAKKTMDEEDNEKKK